jgi:ATP-dependent Clp protease ATP-binding subunit ClpB
MIMHSTTLDPTKLGREAEELKMNLRERVVGQEEAIDQIVNVYQTWLTGITAAGRPISNFLFLGPTGSGKTRLVEATAESLFNNPHAVVRIDCAEFQQAHEIARLIGSPPGYIGHRETKPLLSQDLLDRQHTDVTKISLVLFDEIEKASDALWNLLLGVLDKATLTLGDGSKVDFSKTMIFMTSNVGAAEISAQLQPRLGFVTSRTQDEMLNAKMSRSGLEAVRRKFTPEFVNRLDHVVVFKPLGSAELERILNLELNQVRQRIVQGTNQQQPFVFSISDAGKQFLLQEGTDKKFGARHLKRAIERLVVQPISNLIGSNQVSRGDEIVIDHQTGSTSMKFMLENAGVLPLFSRAG